ncbi:MAG: hypothetical protein OXB88_07920 [Bacteriovoracales bacterium]|nr:hypothetical protein [Bacteriovoracales bacterium]
MIELAKNKHHQSIAIELKNRGYLFNIIEYIQEKIEKSIKIIPLKNYNKEIKPDIDLWRNDFNRQVRLIINMDQKILEYLNYEKDQIKKEASSVHKKRIAHTKYHLSALKR